MALLASLQHYIKGVAETTYVPIPLEASFCEYMGSEFLLISELS